MFTQAFSFGTVRSAIQTHAGAAAGIAEFGKSSEAAHQLDFEGAAYFPNGTVVVPVGFYRKGQFCEQVRGVVFANFDRGFKKLKRARFVPVTKPTAEAIFQEFFPFDNFPRSAVAASASA